MAWNSASFVTLFGSALDEQDKRKERCGNGSISSFIRHFLGATACHPPAVAKADEHGGGSDDERNNDSGFCPSPGTLETLLH
jgi:hypothetical protein